MAGWICGGRMSCGFLVFCKYSRRFYMLLYGAGAGFNKVPFCPNLSSVPLLLVSLMIY